MTINFPNLMKKIDTWAQEAQRAPKKLDPKRPTPSHIIIKMETLKDKERILKATREKQVVTYKGTQIRLSSDFSIETFQVRKKGYKIFNVMKSKDLQPRLLYVANVIT